MTFAAFYAIICPMKNQKRKETAANEPAKARASMLSLAQLTREIRRERRANKPLNLWG